MNLRTQAISVVWFCMWPPPEWLCVRHLRSEFQEGKKSSFWGYFAFTLGTTLKGAEAVRPSVTF